MKSVAFAGGHDQADAPFSIAPLATFDTGDTGDLISFDFGPLGRDAKGISRFSFA